MRIASFRHHEGCRLPLRRQRPLHLELVPAREDQLLQDQNLQSWHLPEAGFDVGEEATPFPAAQGGANLRSQEI